MTVADPPTAAAPVKQLRAIKGDPDAQFDVPVLEKEQAYRSADSLETVVQNLIKAFPDRFSSLSQFQIRVMWVNHGRTSHGREILGQAKRPNMVWKHFLEDVDYILFVASDHCRTQMLTNYACEALLFRLLCQCFVDAEGKLTIADPDWAGFTAEVAAYGCWTEELKLGKRALASAPVQLSMDDVQADDDKGDE